MSKPSASGWRPPMAMRPIGPHPLSPNFGAAGRTAAEILAEHAVGARLDQEEQAGPILRGCRGPRRRHLERQRNRAVLRRCGDASAWSRSTSGPTKISELLHIRSSPADMCLDGHRSTVTIVEPCFPPVVSRRFARPDAARYASRIPHT